MSKEKKGLLDKLFQLFALADRTGDGVTSAKSVTFELKDGTVIHASPNAVGEWSKVTSPGDTPKHEE